MKNHQELTLAYINGYRAAKGLKLLTEFPENMHKRSESRSATCPITKALEVRAYAGGNIVDDNVTHDVYFDVPAYVLETERQFDQTKRTV